jgi:putative oxidoreductase
MKFLSRFEAFAYPALRIVSGFTYSCHGAKKLFGVFGGHSQLHNPLMLAAGIIEFGCGILILLGLFTRYAAFVATGEMAVAYLTSHAPRGLFPIVNRGELALIYCFLFLFIACRGAGKWGIDKG